MAKKTTDHQMPRLKSRYSQEILPELQKELKVKNVMAVPRIKKVVINMGVTNPQEIGPREKAIENIVAQFRTITGQQPNVTRSKKSIAGFKSRAGDPVGVMVTLRGDRMWQFLDKLISITLPRVKDFRGIPRTSFDGNGNYSLGIEEQIVFPEISYDQIESVRGLQINIITSTTSDEVAFQLLTKLGMPFVKEESN